MTSLKTSLEVVKKQVWVVSTSVESLKKKNTPDPTFKATTYFSDPQDQFPFHVVPTTLQSKMKYPGDIIFPKPETNFLYAPMANPSMFSSLNSSSPGHKMTIFEWLKLGDDPDTPSSSYTVLNKFEEALSAPPTLEDLEFLVNNFSPPDKETF